MKSKIKQQQTIVTSKTLHPIKKTNNEVKMASDTNQTKQNNLYFARKDMGPVHNKVRYQ